MAYQNTGYARNKTLTVTKGEYERSYNITDSFTDPANSEEYGALSNQAFQRLNEEEYQIRLQAFIRYVYSLENGLQADCPDLTVGSVEYNPTMCPVPIQAEATEDNEL
jgi:hypothetical protein